jgi:hypothetical protein
MTADDDARVERRRSAPAHVGRNRAMSFSAEIRSVIDEHGARRLAHGGGFWRDWRQHELEQRQRELRDAAAEAFAALNGWRVAGRKFSSRALARRAVGCDWQSRQDFLGGSGPTDHAVCFREPVRPYRSVAIVGQPYYTQYGDGRDMTIEQARELAVRFGLALHVPPNLTASWHYPEWTRFVVFTRPGTAVRFLPEQMLVAPKALRPSQSRQPQTAAPAPRRPTITLPKQVVSNG